jgi:endonuclease/exonuclease/phosphatase (EEP) superfamily protein YafD
MAGRAGAGGTTDGDPDDGGRVDATADLPMAASGDDGTGVVTGAASNVPTAGAGTGPAPADDPASAPAAPADGAAVDRRSQLGRALRPAVAWALVAPLVVWLAVRATGLGAGTTVETFIVFTPYVALASVVALAAVALLRVRPAAVAAGLCCIGYGLVMAPLFVAAEGPTPAPTGPELRVMSSNVQFGWADAARVVDLVEQHDIEVLGIQELTPVFHRLLVAEGIEDVLPHGVVDARYGASGTGLYSRYPVEEVGSTFPPTIPGEHAHPTGLVAVPGAPPVQVTVVHPVPPVLSGAVDAWQETLAALPRPDPGGTVHLLVGDFNATVDQPTMRALLDDGYTDAALALGHGWQPTWQGRGLGPMLTIDHVLVDRSTAVEDVSVHDVGGSDHRALVAALRLPEG